MCIMMSTMVSVTMLYAIDVIHSGWTAARLFAGVGYGALDLVHTILIHLMFVFYPECRPEQPVNYMSGARLGPPGLKA